jgi:hypothetical protein
MPRHPAEDKGDDWRSAVEFRKPKNPFAVNIKCNKNRLKPLLRLLAAATDRVPSLRFAYARSESPPREAWREFCCGVSWLRYPLPMTQERLSNVVLTAALVVVAAVWLGFLLAYAEWIFRHFVPSSP